MRFIPTTLKDATLIELDKRADDRGYFARTFCEEEFRAAGLPRRFVQANSAGTRLAGTLRGLHYQKPPHAEAKLVRCTQGAVYDAIIDLRLDSPTYGRWEGFELDAASGRMLLVPESFAHGYQTLADNTEVLYLVSYPYAPGAEAGIRFDDPAFGIEWPLAVTSISEKDLSWPDYQFSSAT
jgi:dTDP-4-dehydrorhamnose 3,5-epimerase